MKANFCNVRLGRAVALTTLERFSVSSATVGLCATEALYPTEV